MSAAIKGTAASPGIAIARIFCPREAPPPEGLVMEPAAACGDPEGELGRFHQAVAATRGELKTLRDRTRAELGELKAEIFEAHLSIAGDPELAGAVEAAIRQDGASAAAALDKAANAFIELMAGLGDELFTARINDIKDVTGRIRGHIDGTANAKWLGMQGELIIVADDLSPSETTQFDRAMVKGFVTRAGSRTSHSSILARSLEIPAVVGLGKDGAALRDGEWLIVDGTAGLVIANPDAATLAGYRQRQLDWLARRELEKRWATQPTLTACGHHVELATNIGGAGDLPATLAAGAEGVGLFRTEFMYMDRAALPSEDEQYQVYRQVLHSMAGRPVVIRTLDIGGDKKLDCLPIDPEMNPFLGVRAIRLCLEQEGVFRTQLRALLRASVHGSLRIMFPMIAVLGELRAAKHILAEERQALEASGQAIGADLQVGIMIEIPAAAVMADSLAAEADFFSIGTNDLIQYTMAADRMNPKVGYLYQPLHPAILRLIGMVAEAAHRHGRWVGICGEMASDPQAVPLLLGLGLDELSMSAAAITATRALVAGLDRERCRSLALEARACSTSDEVKLLLP